jgi:hypothetical protein|tara:strand:- start:339 stop:542 length:204 start_codon:yes stop_codon:yes gene_type:complete
MVPGLPPGPLDLQPFASAAVPPVMDARVATIRGRTNSLVIRNKNIKKEGITLSVYILHVMMSTKTLL